MRNKITIEDVKGFIEDLEVEKFREKNYYSQGCIEKRFYISRTF